MAATAVAGAPRLAQQYVDALRPCYEWGRDSTLSGARSAFADSICAIVQKLRFVTCLRVLAAHRWLCALTRTNNEQKPPSSSAGRAYEAA